MAISIDGTNGLTTDNAALKLDGTTLTVDDTNNRVGIGTASPSEELEVVGDFGVRNSGSVDGLVIKQFANDNVAIDSVDGGEILVRVGGTNMLRLNSSGDMKFDSGYGSAATAYGCRAWVNYQGTGTVTIRASGNVSSITDNGTGAYTTNFATAMPDANYSVVSGTSTASGTSGILNQAINASNTRHDFFRRNDGVQADAEEICVAVFR